MGQWLGLHIQCQGCKLNPWSGNWDTTNHMAKKKKKIYGFEVMQSSLKATRCIKEEACKGRKDM